MDVKEIREAFRKQAEDTATSWRNWDPDEAYMAGFETGVDKALSTIDPEAIKWEAITQYRMDELDAVMYSVDKWLPDDYPDGINPATRAADAREIALKAIEAIKRACADAAVAKASTFKMRVLNQNMAWIEHGLSPQALSDLEYAILQAEPGQEKA